MTNFDQLEFTYRVTEAWVKGSVEDRLNHVRFCLRGYKSYENILVQDATDSGHVILRIEETIPANKRGLFLLELEERLKAEVDIGLPVWLEPVGDKSKLRQLRGVGVKS